MHTINNYIKSKLSSFDFIILLLFLILNRDVKEGVVPQWPPGIDPESSTITVK